MLFSIHCQSAQGFQKWMGMYTSSALLPCQLTPFADSGVLDLIPFFRLQSEQNQGELSSLTASSETTGS
jgi:hypothetical protein